MNSKQTSPPFIARDFRDRKPANEPLYQWIKLVKHCEMTGDTPDAVDKRVRSGHWLRDVHVRVPAGSKQLWVNVEAVNNWAAGAPVALRKRGRSAA